MRLPKSHPQTSPPPRRPQPAPAPAPPIPAAKAPAPEPALAAERRLRTAGGPEDHATYACRCGAVFSATPTTSVSCPLCGTYQAW